MTKHPPPPDSNDSTGSAREQRIAEAVAEFHDLRVAEEPVSSEEFSRRHPDLAPELGHALRDLDTLDGLLEVEPRAAGEDQLDLETPESLSGHRILAELGSGGMGLVYLAQDDRLGRKLAIKVLQPKYSRDEPLRERFMQEARAMARVNHPHVVRIYDLGEPSEVPHFVMEYVEGASLTDAARPLELRQRVELLLKVVDAVHFLHQNGIIHRDLKPGNVLVGSDLEPKVLDFGLALPLRAASRRLTLSGQIMGTPDYFSPEQARGAAAMGPRSDVFSLGSILFELLTGQLPFQAPTLGEQVEMICDQDPTLPRRIDPSIPGDLQNICMKALEKEPADRYASAREMAADLERFLTGEPVLAAPSSYTRLMAGKIDQHLRELGGWRQDQILSDEEFDGFRKLYDRLVEREDSWILEMRRFSLSQVSLYLGAWVLCVGAALILLFRYPSLSGTPAVLVVAAALLPAAYLGLQDWRRGRLRLAVAWLLASCLLLPIGLLVAMHEWGWLAKFSQDDAELELFSSFSSFKLTTNAQLWWALALSLPAYYGVRRFTGSSVFTLVLAVMSALLCLVTLLRMGLLRWLEDDPGRPYFYLIPFALLFFAIGMILEYRRYRSDSRYFYPIAVFFTLVALSGVALFHEPYASWLEETFRWTRGQVEYLFMINAGVYLLLQQLSIRFPSAQMRGVAKAFRFVIPGHVLTSLLLLGLTASELWEESPADPALRFEARFFEVILPLVACLFIFGSIPRQLKNFLAVGMLFLAIGLIRLQQDLFREAAWWPLFLLLAGMLLMLGAAHYSWLRVTLRRLSRRD